MECRTVQGQKKDMGTLVGQPKERCRFVLAYVWDYVDAFRLAEHLQTSVEFPVEGAPRTVHLASALRVCAVLYCAVCAHVRDACERVCMCVCVCAHVRVRRRWLVLYCWCVPLQQAGKLGDFPFCTIRAFCRGSGSSECVSRIMYHIHLLTSFAPGQPAMTCTLLMNRSGGQVSTRTLWLRSH
eukprot:1146041-Pelagomonas_calceolata.AAC.8